MRYMFHYSAHKSLPLGFFLSQMNSVHLSSPCIHVWSTVILFSHIHLQHSSAMFPLCFPPKILYAILVSDMHATCPEHIITTLGEHHKLWSSSYTALHNLLFHLSWDQILSFGLMLSNTLNLCSSFNMTDKQNTLH